MSVKTVALLWCLDSQVFTDAAIRALRNGRREEAIRAMQCALACSRLAAQKVEGLSEKSRSPSRS